MDIEILLCLQDLRVKLGSVIELVFSVISHPAAIGIMVCFIFYIYWCVNKKDGLYVFICIALGQTLVQLLKNTMCIYRPWIRDTRIKPSKMSFSSATGYSFPSGHASLSVMSLGGITHRNGTKKAKIIAAVLIAMVSFSRCYLGYHTPQDIIVGALIGILTLKLVDIIFKVLEDEPEKQKTALIGGLLFVAAAIIYTVSKSYPMDYANGALLADPVEMQDDGIKAAAYLAAVMTGWCLEEKYVCFKTDCLNAKQKLLRMFFGAGILAIVTALISVTMKNWCEVRIYTFLISYAQILSAMLLVPYVFTKYETNKK